MSNLDVNEGGDRPLLIRDQGRNCMYSYIVQSVMCLQTVFRNIIDLSIVSPNFVARRGGSSSFDSIA